MSIAKSSRLWFLLPPLLVAAACSGDASSGGDTDTSASGADTVAADTLIPPGATGDPCERGADCASGLCTPTASGSVCTEPCTETCPSGFACLPTPSGGGMMCWHQSAIACQPCTTDAQCQLGGGVGNACVSYGALGSFCGLACGATSDCPGGYECNGDGQCVASAGTCSCNAAGILLGAETTCAIDNAFGSCGGSRQCSPAGLTRCVGDTPAAEVCNGRDDDCDGETDEGTDGAACELVNEFGTCHGVISCEDGRSLCVGRAPAAEVCNGVDDNCDGLTDEGQPDLDGDLVVDCQDDDIDGDGTPNGEDCAPWNPDVHPGAAEVCNGRDDNCNGEVDEGLDVATPPACGRYVCGGLDGCRVTCESDAHCTAGSLCDLYDDDDDGHADTCLPSVCGNGEVEIREVCDDGENTGGYGACLPDCSGYGPSCGDGEVAEGHEACDDGALNGQPNFCNTTCTGPTPPRCGNGIVEVGEACDLGAGEGGNSSAPGAACRLDCSLRRCGDGVVDPEHGETCDTGSELGATTCGCQPGCHFAAAETPCRDAAGVCDLAEACDGHGVCPADAKRDASVVCREPAGACDLAETCGGGDDCPADAFADSATVCRASGGACDPAERCTGEDVDCPGDARSGTEVVCRASRGSCDPAETCDGESLTCPEDAFTPPGASCGPALGACETGPCSCDDALECVPSCGDGVLDAAPEGGDPTLAEVCDDGAANGQRDACNATCSGRCDADFSWEIAAGGAESDAGLGIIARATGATVAVGAFTGGGLAAAILPSQLPVPYGTAAFGDHLFRGVAQLDFFVMAQHSDGAPLWAACGGGWGDDEARGVGVDRYGATYVAGTFSGEGYAGCCDFEGYQRAPTYAEEGCADLTPAGEYEDDYADVFVTKYDEEGQLLWAATAGAPFSDDRVGGAATDPFGRTIVVGLHGGSGESPARFDDLELSSDGDAGDLFVARIDSNGFFDQAQGVGDPATRDMATAVALDGAGNAYVAGFFGGSFTWDGVAVMHSHDASLDEGDGLDEGGAPRRAELFVAKLAPDGHVLWVATARGDDGDIVPNGIAVDGQGQAHVVGAFHGGSARFGAALPLPGTSDTAVTDLFVAKLSPEGAWTWARAAERGESPHGEPGDNVAWGVAVDRAGGVYVTGQLSGVALVGSQRLEAQPTDTCRGLCSPSLPADGIDGFVAKLDRDGAWRWAKLFGGAGDDQGRGLALDPRGNVYLTGTYRGVATFDGDELIGIAEADGGGGGAAPSFDEGDDVFVAKLRPDGAAEGCSACGDGAVDPGEACDDGDEESPDCEGACDGICSGPANTCGDGWLSCGETTDVGGGPLAAELCLTPTGNLWCFEAPGDTFTYAPVQPGTPMRLGAGVKPEVPLTGLGGNSSQDPDCPVCAPTDPNEKCRGGSARQWGGDGPPLTQGSSARSYCDGDPQTPPCSSLTQGCAHTNDEAAAIECGDYYEFVANTGDEVVFSLDERTTTQGPTRWSLWVSLTGAEGSFEKVTELDTVDFPSQDFGGTATPMHSLDLSEFTTARGPVARQLGVHFRLYAWGAVSVDAAWVLDNVRVGAPAVAPR